MVLVKSLIEAGKYAARYGPKYFKYEKKAFDFLYQDFKPGWSYGVRHGLTAGSIVGGILKNNYSDDTTNGFQPKKPGNGYKTGTSNQARNRQSRRSGRRYSKRYKANRNCGCACHR